MPNSVLTRMRAVIPDRQRSKFISEIVERELEKREQALFQCAMKVEQDEALNQEMQAWDITVSDGIDNESW